MINRNPTLQKKLDVIMKRKERKTEQLIREELKIKQRISRLILENEKKLGKRIHKMFLNNEIHDLKIYNLIAEIMEYTDKIIALPEIVKKTKKTGGK